MAIDRSKPFGKNFGALKGYINAYLEEKGEELATDEQVIRFMGYLDQLCYESASTREMTDVFTEGIAKKTRNSAKWVVPDLIFINSWVNRAETWVTQDYDSLDSTINDFFIGRQQGSDES